jgi:hypothetical protein
VAAARTAPVAVSDTSTWACLSKAAAAAAIENTPNPCHNAAAAVVELINCVKLLLLPLT